MLRRFAVVKLWPELQTAEDECVARIKIAAQTLGIECVEINPDGTFRAEPELRVSEQNVDFVIHLHYETPKQYDAFSFVALWNPVAIFHWWSYNRCSRNLTSHDDFLSCSSDAADDHVGRRIRNFPTHLPPKFRLYHSTSDIVGPPTLDDEKLFYIGINWDVLGLGHTRHQQVLKKLDETGMLRIYGPHIFQGVEVWKGYKSYQGELPFDGISVIKQISRAGIALVFSSQMHKDSELMSNRLFESVAAGALVICDENPFGRKFFGDTLLYVNSQSPVDELFSDICRHVEWAKANQSKALEMIRRAQEIFSARFALSGSIADLYDGLEQRKRALRERLHPADSFHVALHLLLPDYSDTGLMTHVKSASVQTHTQFSAILHVQAGLSEAQHARIEAALSTCRARITLKETSFRDAEGSTRKLGRIIQDIVDDSRQSDALVIVAPNEAIYSNHLSVLAGVLAGDKAINCASTAAILKNGSGHAFEVHEIIDFGGINPDGPPGYGRFMFRMTAVPDDINLALPHLNYRPMAVLVGNHSIVQQLSVTIEIDVRNNFNFSTSNQDEENAVIRDFSSRAFNVAVGFQTFPAGGPDARSWTARNFISRIRNYRWIVSQISALRHEGFTARLRILRERLKR